MRSVVCAVFFLSGAAALVFEALWFQVAGLVLGNSVWAGAIVLAAFMAGLALGNALAGARGDAAGPPLRWYAAAEAVVAVTGVGIVMALPATTPALRPLFRELAGNAPLVNAVRLAVAAAVMLVPATAMGATLPLMVRALAGAGEFGGSLGALYGWNTLGATTGVLAAEVVLIPALGVRGTGLFAGALSLAAAAGAWALPAREGRLPPPPSPGGGVSPRARRLLGAAFLCGLVVLALEVLWFRFLALFFSTVSRNFAIMLALALAGIGLGGLAASRLARSAPARAVAPAAGLLASAAAVALLYGSAGALLDAAPEAREELRLALAAAGLILPVTLLSGALFTFIGRALRAEGLGASRATGLLGLANTAGGVLGSLAAGFVLIPWVGVEGSFFLLALAYLAGAALAWPGGNGALAPRARRALGGAAVAAALAVAVFPFGAMRGAYLARTIAPFERHNGERRVALREGVAETIQYLEKPLLGKPYYHRLVTDSNSMSSTTLASRRYMKYFVYLPAALHPRLESALLICFGCGSTARALTETPELKRIDVVDVSREVVELSTVVYPDPAENPVRDPRVQVHIEDGRFFLQTTARKYDLITAEPPPPRNSGIVNLYTREYFELIRDRLADGGFVSYWLPVAELTRGESQAVLAAFAAVFPDVTVWSGAGYEWVLLGSKGAAGPVSGERFRRLWRDEATAGELRALGFPTPEEFGALFVADGARLLRWVDGRPPLLDDRPRRLSAAHGDPAPSIASYETLMEPEASRANFLASPTVARLWPGELLRETVEHFATRGTVNRLIEPRAPREGDRAQFVRSALADPALRPYRLWVLESDRYAQRIVAGSPLPPRSEPTDRAVALKHLAAAAADGGDYAAAAACYAELVELLSSGGGDPLLGELTERYARYGRLLEELAGGTGGRGRGACGREAPLL